MDRPCAQSANSATENSHDAETCLRGAGCRLHGAAPCATVRNAITPVSSDPPTDAKSVCGTDRRKGNDPARVAIGQAAAEPAGYAGGGAGDRQPGPAE